MPMPRSWSGWKTERASEAAAMASGASQPRKTTSVVRMATWPSEARMSGIA